MGEFWVRRRAAVRRAAGLWALVAGAALVALAFRRLVPASADLVVIPRYVAMPVQAGLVGAGVLGVGLVVAGRWAAAGLALAALATALLGFVAWVQYRPLAAVLVIAALAAPVVLLAATGWFDPPGRAFRATALATVVAVAAATVGAHQLYGFFYGPTHPESAARAAPVDRVVWTWAGALTPTAFTVTARLVAPAEARLVVSTSPDLRRPRHSPPRTAAADGGLAVRLTAAGLRPGTRYHYGVEVGGRLDRSARGRLTTPPAGPASFRFAVGACARTGSSGSVFDAIRAADPLFYLNTGDLYYGDVDTADLDRFRRLYDATLTAPAQAALYRSTATAYVWDDHDFGPNNADRDSPSRGTAARAYRESVPHYPLAGPAGPVYQAFTVGRVRFLLTDSRYARSPGDTPAARRSALGEAQLAWLEAELRAGRDRYALIVWVNPIPWIDDAGSGSDTWAGFPAERQRIADLVADAGIRNLLMVSGDAHMLAIDDGSHSDYSSRRAGGFPVLHAAPLDRPGSVKGGPYSHGTSIDGGQFGLVDVDDPGRGPVTVRLSGRAYTGAEVLRYSFTSPRP